MIGSLYFLLSQPPESPHHEIGQKSQEQHVVGGIHHAVSQQNQQALYCFCFAHQIVAEVIVRLIE